MSMRLASTTSAEILRRFHCFAHIRIWASIFASFYTLRLFRKTKIRRQGSSNSPRADQDAWSRNLAAGA